ncbi:hypothetical protein ATEIFO6365_0002028000 [Aspergillus terreus]|uniref:Uncharacterized protein n=1 Tax=Aspergillus terreus TaxID=33178 RepID=A0A5M3YTZ0_ASPTE|nr:hypothetical protein ATETN484_0004028000 [Aspergillus terreus]GFF13170.1 hypothetical protein ATEIFO6365_0002028000 [Aspergillus terreus]
MGQLFGSDPLGFHFDPRHISDRSPDGERAFILACNTTIYDIQYDHVNGSITRSVPMPSNISTSNIWQSIVSNIADVTNTADQAVLAARWCLRGGAESLEKRPALAVQARITPLVTRIPAAPLITLVVVNLLHVVCGFVFAAVAIISARGEVPEIQARLNVMGLVADRFEKPGTEVSCAEEMF